MNKFITVTIIVILFLLITIGIYLYTKNNVINSKKEDKMEINKIKLIIGSNELTATLENNSSSQALINKLKEGDITIQMSDYAGMEKVGTLEFDLPQNNKNIKTEAGDLILYQGNNFVIYYDNNNWSLTKLGKIDNISQKELINILGEGNVIVTLSLID